MKGSIVECIRDLMTAKFGAAKWKEALKRAGLPESQVFSSLDDVPDAQVLGIMKGVAEAASLTMPQVMDAFGEYWSTQYAPTVYRTYFTAVKSTRELLLKLNDIHLAMTKNMKSARPPRFRYEWKDDKHLVMHYESLRGLVALMPGLVRGLGKYFNDSPSVNLAGNEVHVKFA